MSNQPVKSDQLSLILRMGAGAYVLYSAWKIRGAAMEKPLFLIIMVLFILAGGFITATAGWKLWKEVNQKREEDATEETEES